MSPTEEQPDPARAERARQGDIDLNLFGDAHVRRYEETDGAEGYIWNGAPILVLTTKGAKTGKTRKHALIFGEHDGRYLVVASKGGAPEHPQWYDNLVAHPDVQVQVKGDRFDAAARTASADERPELWPTMAAIWPSYDDYQAATDREIPVVVLERR